jgi:sulfide:quinone oxidoreductase
MQMNRKRKSYITNLSLLVEDQVLTGSLSRLTLLCLGGIALAAQLKRELNHKDRDIAIIEPKEVHYYQPLWTLVGGGIVGKKQESARPEKSVIPKGTSWVKDSVQEFRPASNEVVTKEGKTIKYDYMVVAAGLEIDWNKIQGLKEAIGKDGVSTIYSYDTVDKTFDFIKNTKSGNAIFTVPDTPVKCGGAPQKIMWLAEAYWRKAGVRENMEVFFALPGGKNSGRVL